MIETVMIFALGFLAASFLALLVLPAINRRAERLAKRRLKALFPLSLEEIAAERDHLRAEFAVSTRQLEHRIDKLIIDKASALGEAGRRAASLKSVEDELAHRKEAFTGLSEEAEGLRLDLSLTRDTLADTRNELTETRKTLVTRISEHERLDELHRMTERDLETRNLLIAELETRIAALDTDLARANNHFAERAMALQSEQARADKLSRSLAQERQEAAELAQRLASVEAIRDDQSGRLDKLQAHEGELARRLTEASVIVARQDDQIRQRETRLGVLATEIDALKAEMAKLKHAGQHEVLALSETLEELKAERSALDGALSQARDDRVRLQRELAGAKRKADQAGETVEADNQALRNRIEAVAAEIMRATASDEDSSEEPSTRKSRRAV